MTASNAPGFLENSIASPGTAAMMLALTQTIYDEELAKKLVAKKGLKAVVTEVGGKTSFYDFNERINRAVFGKSALHYMTNHERAGLGVMHI